MLKRNERRSMFPTKASPEKPLRLPPASAWRALRAVTYLSRSRLHHKRARLLNPGWTRKQESLCMSEKEMLQPGLDPVWIKPPIGTSRSRERVREHEERESCPYVQDQPRQVVTEPPPEKRPPTEIASMVSALK